MHVHLDSSSGCKGTFFTIFLTSDDKETWALNIM